MDYPWFEIIEGESISQGDIITNCPVIIIPPGGNFEEEYPEVIIQTIDVIVMTQACDLEQGNVTDVILCGLSDASSVKTRNGRKPDSNFFKNVKDGKNVSLHLLSDFNMGEELKSEHKVVDLRQLYSLPLESLRIIAEKRGKRLRLLPPYREHLSQAFARVFMRVGLPSDIDIGKIKL